MKYFLLGLLLAVSGCLSAQPLVEASSVSMISPFIYSQPFGVKSVKMTQMLPGERMRNTGAALTIVGAGLLVGGIALASNADSYTYNQQSNSSGSYEEGDPKGAVGVLMITGGVGMMVPGIIFWSKGSKRYKAALHQPDPEASLHLKGNGLAIRYRF